MTVVPCLSVLLLVYPPTPSIRLSVHLSIRPPILCTYQTPALPSDPLSFLEVLPTPSSHPPTRLPTPHIRWRFTGH